MRRHDGVERLRERGTTRAHTRHAAHVCDVSTAAGGDVHEMCSDAASGVRKRLRGGFACKNRAISGALGGLCGALCAACVETGGGDLERAM